MHVTVRSTNKSLLETSEVGDRMQIVAELIPGTANLVIASAKLLGDRILSPVEVLLRAILDRLGTIAFLRKNEKEAVSLWNSGWKQNDRPDFRKKLQCLPNKIWSGKKGHKKSTHFDFTGVRSQIISLLKSMHGSVHGDPASIDNTLVGLRADGAHHTIGPDLENIEYFSKLCSLLTISTMLFVFEMDSAFGLHEGIE